MKLTDELYKIGCERFTRKSCVFIDDSHVLLTERLTVSDDKISTYVENLRKAREAGINVSSIIDYKMIPNSAYVDDRTKCNYSVGVFLMDMAKGNTLDLKCLDLDYVSTDFIPNEINKYLRLSNEYIEEMEKRANAAQSFYDKLVSDCLDLNKFGLEIDPKPSNYFFDMERGFSITSVRNISGNVDFRFSKSFITYIHYIVYGYGRPVISINKEFYTKLPEEYVKRLLSIYKCIDEKIKNALITNGVDNSIIENVFISLNKKYQVAFEVASGADMERDIEELRNSNKEVNRKNL